MSNAVRITRAVLTCALSVAASKQDRTDVRRLVRALKDGDSLRERRVRLREVADEIKAEEAVRDAERAEHKATVDTERAQRATAKAVKLTARCVYLGSSRPHAGLKPGRRSWFSMDAMGINVGVGKGQATIPWEEVQDVEVIDASRMEIKSRVEQRAIGGLWAPPGTMAPVSRTSSKHIARSKLALETEQGDWLLEVHADAGTLEGKLLLARGER